MSLTIVVELVLLGFWWVYLPRVTITPEIRDVALEMRRTIIELDGVLIGFAGLIGTMIFTRPIESGRDRIGALRATLAMVLFSVGSFIISVFLALFSLSYTFAQSAVLADRFFTYSACSLVIGVNALGLMIVEEVHYQPPQEQTGEQTGDSAN